MTSPSLTTKPLVVLTADKNAQFALRGIFSRARSLNIQPIRPDYHIHPEKDPGVLRNAHEFLRPSSRLYQHALVVMDREGSGQEGQARETMERQIESAMSQSGWGDRAAAIVIDPELDLWVWSSSPHVDGELGWTGRQPGLRTWLKERGFLTEGMPKPARPKEALEAALREVKLPRSSSIYEALAKKVSLARCTDPAFAKLQAVLRDWFPPS